MGEVNSVNKLCQQAEVHFFRAVASVEYLLKTPQNQPTLLAALEKNNHNMALPLYCYACLIVGDITTAAMLIKKAEKKEKLKAYIPLLKGQLFFICKDYQKAAQFFSEVVNANNQQFFAWNKLFTVAITAGWHVQGEQWYRQALTLPDWQLQEKIALLDFAGCFLVHQYKFTETLALCRQQLLLHIQVPVNKEVKSKNKKSWNKEAAWQTLNDILTLLESADLKPFPTAGTLLGWVREGDLLPFDKDLDLAFPPEDDLALAKHLLQMSSLYEIPVLSMNYTSMFSVQDKRTGITVDLLSFAQSEKEGQFNYGWFLPGKPREEGRLLTFDAFTLEKKSWKDLQVWCPNNSDQYLTQLYGNWREPNPQFDGVVGVKNLTHMTPLVQAFGYNNLMIALKNKKYVKAMATINALIEKGDNSVELNCVKEWLITNTLVDKALT